MEILVTAIPGTNSYQYSFLIKIYVKILFRLCEICDFEVDNLEDIFFLEAYSPNVLTRMSSRSVIHIRLSFAIVCLSFLLLIAILIMK